MRCIPLVVSLLLCAAPQAQAQVGIGIGLPGVSIGIHFETYPNLVAIPGYPVYYAPQGRANYFFYDGLYWVYESDNWYSSSWYDGPWQQIGPEYVPLYVLRVPVRYYREPPAYFRGWQPDRAPRWAEHWGRDWEKRRGGWDQWDRRSVPRAAPLPAYQRQYSGDRYPQAADRQQSIRIQQYRYQPAEAMAQRHFQQQGRPAERPPAAQGRNVDNRGQENRGPDNRGHDDRGQENKGRGNERGSDRR